MIVKYKVEVLEELEFFGGVYTNLTRKGIVSHL